MSSYENGLVSIIIPTYNSANYIKTAIDSCLNQEYDNIEIIVIDDGSTDNTRSILDEYIYYDKIKYIYQKNMERSIARNNGILIAKGEFLQFLDADDYLAPDKIAKQVEIMKTNLCINGVYCFTKYFSEYSNKIRKYHHSKNGAIMKKMLLNNIIPINSMLIRNEPIYYDTNYHLCEDWDYWLQRCYKNDNFFCIREYLCYVRLHNSNSSINEARMNDNRLLLMKKWYSLLNGTEYESVVEYKLFELYFDKGERRIAREYLLKSVKSEKLFLIYSILHILKKYLYIIVKRNNVYMNNLNLEKISNVKKE